MNVGKTVAPIRACGVEVNCWAENRRWEVARIFRDSKANMAGAAI
jgi:hypothetical protein